MEKNDSHYLDLLRHIERLTEETNKRMNSRSKILLRKYPLTFTLIALFGVVSVSEGMKGIIEKTLYLIDPVNQLVVGLFILVVLGSVYKKLDK